MNEVILIMHDKLHNEIKFKRAGRNRSSSVDVKSKSSRFNVALMSSFLTLHVELPVLRTRIQSKILEILLE